MFLSGRHEQRLFDTGNPVKKKTRQPVGIRTALTGLKPGADHPNPPTPRPEPRRGSGLQPRRGRAAVSPGSCAHPGPLNATDPSGVPSGGGDPQTGARAWRSLLAVSPACGHRPRASDLRHTRAPSDRLLATSLPREPRGVAAPAYSQTVVRRPSSVSPSHRPAPALKRAMSSRKRFCLA